MREQFRGFPLLKQGKIDESICPTKALKSNPISIDLGKCTLCGACKSEAVQFSNYYKLSSTNRNSLIIQEGMTPEDFEKIAIQSRKEIKEIFGNSLKLRQVSPGGCNGCEMELNACSNCNFDMGRFGIDFVASPRHADGLVITGPITKNMAYALDNCLKSTPDPKIIILCGTCAISGGVFKDSEELNRELQEKYPIDLYIPGCPVHPLTFINAVLGYIKG
jgi:Ni,Fe-hydrogenase III small subunit